MSHHANAGPTVHGALVLLAISRGLATRRAVAHDLGIAEKRVSRILCRLERYGLVVRVGCGLWRCREGQPVTLAALAGHVPLAHDGARP